MNWKQWPSKEPTFPTLGKGKSSTQKCQLLGDMGQFPGGYLFLAIFPQKSIHLEFVPKTCRDMRPFSYISHVPQGFCWSIESSLEAPRRDSAVSETHTSAARFANERNVYYDATGGVLLMNAGWWGLVLRGPTWAKILTTWNVTWWLTRLLKCFWGNKFQSGW